MPSYTVVINVVQNGKWVKKKVTVKAPNEKAARIAAENKAIEQARKANK